MTLLLVFRKDDTVSKIRYTKPVLIVSVVAVLIGGCLVLASIAHPFISQSGRPHATDGVSAKTGPASVVEPSSRQEVSLKAMYTQMLVRIKAARGAKDMGELKKLGDEIEIIWSSLDASSYASLMLEVCNALSSTDLGDNNQYVLEQRFASFVLDKQLQIPPATEANLVLHLQEDIDYVKGQVNTDEWVATRLKKAEIWLRTWQRLNAAIDPNFDFEDLPLTNVPLPPGVPGAAGMSPDHIKDLALRAQYQKAIDENSKKAETYRTQFTLYRTRETFAKLMETYLIRAYSRPPDNPKELEAILKAHSVDDSIRSRILNSLKN